MIYRIIDLKLIYFNRYYLLLSKRCHNVSRSFFGDTLNCGIYSNTIQLHPVQFPSEVKVTGEMGSARPLAPLLRSQWPMEDESR